MAKLSELRSKLRTGELEAELENGRDEREKRYKIGVDGKDALIKFGRHKSLTLGQIDVFDPGYLDWIVDSKPDFPGELKDVVRYIRAAGASDEILRASEEIASSIAGGPRKMPMIGPSSSLRGDKKR